MKNDKIFTSCWAGGLALLLGLGSVGSLASGLDLPVGSTALVLLCAVLAIFSALIVIPQRGILMGLGLGLLPVLNPDFWTQVKTLAAAIALRLQLAYSIPTPSFLQGELSDSVLAVLCGLGYLIMLLTARCVQKQKSCLLPVAVSLIPLAGCITVIDTVPDTPWLFLWGLGLLLLLLTQGVRRRSHSQGNRLGSWLLLPTVGALVLLFTLISRDATLNWLLPLPNLAPGTSQGGVATAPQEQVDLRDLGPRSPTRTTVMEVTSDFAGPLYLRCRDYDEYTGTGWLATEQRNEILFGYSMRWHQDYGQVEISTVGTRDHYVIPDYTQQVQAVVGGAVKNPEGQTTYRFDRCILQPDWAEYWEGDPFVTVNPRYLELPEETARQATVYLVENQLLGDTPVQQAQRIAAAVQDSASYDLFTPNMPQEEEDLALWFLGSSDTGYCVHFATATAVLLRAAGIPARYVEGYLVQAEAVKTVPVRELHAHAWVEYYVDQIGWVVLEATPSDGILQEDIPDPTGSTTESSTEPTQEPTVPTDEATAPTQQTQQKDPGLVSPQSDNRRVWFWICGLCLALALVMGQYVLRRQLIRKALEQKDPNRRGLATYRQAKKLCRFLRKPISQELSDLAQKARFSSHHLTKQELKEMHSQLSRAQKEAAQAPLPRRLWARWILALY